MSDQSALVLDGETVKLRILAERVHSGHVVHIDWLRFTCRLRNAPAPDVDVLFPLHLDPAVYYLNEIKERQARIVDMLRELPDCDHQASMQAWELAQQVAAGLGSAFTVELVPRKGMDFYKYRWSICLNESECAWVGFGSSSDSPRQSKQSQTIHANVNGVACTFADVGWRDRLADLIDECQAVVTRADLALDCFDGIAGGIDSVRVDYRAGACNVGGRKLKFSMVGDWENGHDRSVYIGSRQAGKVTNVYEKGDQLYGAETCSEWIRFELRYGNKLRVLSSDMLRRPDDFFAGASDWHEAVLSTARATFTAQKVPVKKRLEVESVQAECVRNVRWIVQTAASSMAVAFNFIESDKLWDLIGHAKLPGRLRKFSLSQISESFADAVGRVSLVGQSPTGLPSLNWA